MVCVYAQAPEVGSFSIAVSPPYLLMCTMHVCGHTCYSACVEGRG